MIYIKLEKKSYIDLKRNNLINGNLLTNKDYFDINYVYLYVNENDLCEIINSLDNIDGYKDLFHLFIFYYSIMNCTLNELIEFITVNKVDEEKLLYNHNLFLKNTSELYANECISFESYQTIIDDHIDILSHIKRTNQFLIGEYTKIYFISLLKEYVKNLHIEFNEYMITFYYKEYQYLPIKSKRLELYLPKIFFGLNEAYINYFDDDENQYKIQEVRIDIYNSNMNTLLHYILGIFKQSNKNTTKPFTLIDPSYV